MKKVIVSKRKPSKRKKVLPSLLTLFPEYRKEAYINKVKENENNNISELRNAYQNQGLVLYIGSGVSRSIGLPNWTELIRSLTVTMMMKKVNTSISTLAEYSDDEKYNVYAHVYEQVDKSADIEKPILLMARAIKDEMKDELSHLIASKLYRSIRYRVSPRKYIFSKKTRISMKEVESRYRLPSSPLVDSIINISRAQRDAKGVQAIINYNFDDLLETKLKESNVKCKTITSGKDKVLQGVLPCYHVHGVIPIEEYSNCMKKHKRVPMHQLIFSEDEYHAEYADAYKWSNMTQMNILGRNFGLFIGLSLEDPNIRRLIDVTHKQYPEIINYAILPRRRRLNSCKDDDNAILQHLYETVEAKSFEGIGVKVIWVDDYDEIPKLINSLCT